MKKPKTITLVGGPLDGETVTLTGREPGRWVEELVTGVVGDDESRATYVKTDRRDVYAYRPKPGEKP